MLNKQTSVNTTLTTLPVVSSLAPEVRQGASSILYKDQIISFAGRINSDKSVKRKGRNLINELWKGKLMKLNDNDIVIDWQLVSPDDDNSKIQKRHNHTSILWNNKMIIFGGSNNDKYFNDIIEFDLTTDKFTKINMLSDEIPEPRHGHTAILYNNEYMIVFGGKLGKGFQAEYKNDVWKYHLPTKTWTKVQVNQKSNQMPQERCWHTCILYKGRYMLLFGGFYSAKRMSKHFNDLWSFDLETNQWELLNDNFGIDNLPNVRNRHGCFVMEDQFFVFFGNYYKNRKDLFLNDVCCFDLLQKKWKLNIDLKMDRLDIYGEGLGHFCTLMNDNDAVEGSIIPKNSCLIFSGELAGLRRTNETSLLTFHKDL
ncbi:hypothetical protein ABK040_008081 [Willaertia magna]